MNFLIWLEESSVADYIRVSLTGYPMMITLHSLGMAIMIGLSVVLSLRVLGMFEAIPYSSLQNLLKIAWIGFIVNFVSGTFLFTAQATTYITDFEFLAKMTCVIAGAVFVALLQNEVKSGASAWGNAAAVPQIARIYAGGTIAAWTVGMVTGRLIAYL